MSIPFSSTPPAGDFDRLLSVLDIARELTPLRTLDQLLPRVVDIISRSLGYCHVGLMIKEGDYLVCRAVSDKRAERYVGALSLKVGREGITGWVAASGRSVLIRDVRRDPRYVRLDTDVDVRAALAVPVKSRSGIIGVLDVDVTHPAQLSEADVWVLERVADQIAVAIENAALYEQLGGYAQRLEAVVSKRTKALDDATAYSHRMRSMLETTRSSQTVEERFMMLSLASSAPPDDPDGGISSEKGATLEGSELTVSEVRVLELIALGLTDKAMAERLVISPHTVNAHLRSIYRKLGTHSRTGAVHLARSRNIIP